MGLPSQLRWCTNQLTWPSTNWIGHCQGHRVWICGLRPSRAWGRISTLGLGLSRLRIEGSKRGVSLAQIIDWTSRKTAEHAGPGASKGELKVGYDRDFVIGTLLRSLRSPRNRFNSRINYRRMRV
ncbi:hypothetical protein K438DRAFT_863770 [Mycena galopus ATCC 62051]|nr:hypothetical protein K438DRAFT_863770 [Mycena galopus ATCC 62051]